MELPQTAEESESREQKREKKGADRMKVNFFVLVRNSRFSGRESISYVRTLRFFELDVVSDTFN